MRYALAINFSIKMLYLIIIYPFLVAARLLLLLAVAPLAAVRPRPRLAPLLVRTTGVHASRLLSSSASSSWLDSVIVMLTALSPPGDKDFPV